MPLEVSHSTAHLAQHSVVLAAALALAAATLLTAVVVELCIGSRISKATGLSVDTLSVNVYQKH